MRCIIPDLFADDIFHIDYELLFKQGFRLLVFDLDHTLISTESSHVSVKTRRLLFKLKKMGFEIAFLSNTVVFWREKRVANIVESTKINVFSVCCNGFHCKPNIWGYEEVCRLTGVESSEAVMIGDMLLRDIFGAIKAKYGFTVLVRPHGPDNIFILRCRIQEKKLLEWLIEIGAYKP